MLLHEWRNAVAYGTSGASEFVNIRVRVENIGSAPATNSEVRGMFTEGSMQYNIESTVISRLEPMEKQDVRFKVSIPKGVSSSLVTQLLSDGFVVDEKESTTTFS